MEFEVLSLGILPTNCYIVYDTQTMQAAVIDPADNAPKILGRIKALGITVKYIFITHAHFDHILGAQDLKEATGAKVVIHKYDDEDLSVAKVARFHPSLKKHYREVKPDIFASDGDVFEIGSLKAEFIHTPGHTIGSCIIKIGRYIFSGDTLFRQECGRCDLAGGNFSSMLDSLKKIYDLDGT